MLKDPEHAVLIRRLALKKTGRRLLDKANELMEQWQSLRQRFRMLSEHHRHLMLRYRKRNSARG
jgi:DNA-binding transcriptional LysR family regulator